MACVAKAAVALPLAVFCLHFAQAAATDPVAARAGENYWERRRPAKSMEIAANAGRCYDAVFVGDSITHAWDDDSDGRCENEGADDWKALKRTYSLLNLGYGGDAIQHVLYRLGDNELDGYTAKMFVLMIGANNKEPAEEIAEGTKACIDLIRRRHPESKIILMAMLPFGAASNDVQRVKSAKVNELTRKLADGKGILWLDIGSRLLLQDGRHNAYMWLADHVHPSAATYHVWRETLQPILEAVTGKRASPRPCAARRVLPRHVVFVGFDGLSSSGFERAATPHLDQLRREGAWTLESRSVLPSGSACNWRSFFTCSAPEQHGFTTAHSERPTFMPSFLAQDGGYPDIYRQLRNCRPTAESGLVYEWGGMAFTCSTNSCSFVRKVPRGQAIRAGCEYFREKKPTFLSIVCDRPDGTGHAMGWESTNYLAEVSRLDVELVQLFRTLDETGTRNETVVVISSDHGGKDKDHGGATLVEMRRPVVIVGKGVRRAHELPYGGSIYDTGATVAALLGIDFPPCWIGRPFDGAFDR